MKNYYYVKLPLAPADEQSTYQWHLIHGDTWEPLQTGSASDLYQCWHEQPHDIIYAIAGEKVVTSRVPYQEKEKRHFKKMLPYLIEESVIDDVEQLHIVWGNAANGQATVAYVNEAWLASHHRHLLAHDLPLIYAMADFHCLPVTDGVAVYQCQDRWFAHAPSGLGFSLPSPVQAPALASLIQAEYGQEVIDIHCYGVDEGTLPLSLATHRSHYHNCRETHLSPAWAMNFFSGPYQYQQPLAVPNRSVGILATLLLLAVVTFIGVNGLWIYLHSQYNTTRQADIIASARQVIPQGHIQQNPIRQLKQKLNGKTPSDTTSVATYLLAQAAPVLQRSHVQLQTVHYQDKEKAMRLNIQASAFAQVDQLRNALQEENLDVELLGSNAIDNQFQARLRIRLGE